MLSTGSVKNIAGRARLFPGEKNFYRAMEHGLYRWEYSFCSGNVKHFRPRTHGKFVLTCAHPINETWARVSFRSGNANFCASPGNSRDYAETYIRCAAPGCVPACPVRTADRLRTGKQVIPRIDAGIEQKGHLWIGTRVHDVLRLIT